MLVLLSACQEKDNTVQEKPDAMINQHWQAITEGDFRGFKDSFRKESPLYKEVNEPLFQAYYNDFKKVTDPKNLEWEIVKEISMSESLRNELEKEGYNLNDVKVLLVSIPSIHEKSWTNPNGEKTEKTMIESDNMIYVLKPSGNEWKILYQISETLDDLNFYL